MLIWATSYMKQAFSGGWAKMAFFTFSMSGCIFSACDFWICTNPPAMHNGTSLNRLDPVTIRKPQFCIKSLSIEIFQRNVALNPTIKCVAMTTKRERSACFKRQTCRKHKVNVSDWVELYQQKWVWSLSQLSGNSVALHNGISDSVEGLVWSVPWNLEMTQTQGPKTYWLKGWGFNAETLFNNGKGLEITLVGPKG